MHEVPDEEKGEKDDSNLWTEVWQENVPGKLPQGLFYVRLLGMFRQLAPEILQKT